jgi:hypothetical protein
MAADRNTFFNLTLAKTSQGKFRYQQWQRAGICGPILLACSLASLMQVCESEQVSE